MSPARQAVWTAVVTASALATLFPVGSVILFPQMDGVFPFSRFYLQTNVFLTALTARIIVTPMSGRAAAFLVHAIPQRIIRN